MAAPSTKTPTQRQSWELGPPGSRGSIALGAAFKWTLKRAAMFPRSCCLVSHCVRRSLSGDETWELQSGHRNLGWFKVWQAWGRSCSGGMCQAWSRPGGLQGPDPHPPPALLVLGTPQTCGKRNGCSAGPAQSGELWGWQCCIGEMGTPWPSQPALAPGRRISTPLLLLP